MRDLQTLLRNIDPELNDGEWVFCPTAIADALMTFHEREGVTSIVKRDRAEELRLSHAFPSAWITLRVHSDLEAVGFLAMITRALADAGIACNAVSAFHHDHLFVPVARREEVMRILHGLA